MSRLRQLGRSRGIGLAIELVLIAAVFTGTYRLAFRHLTAAQAVSFISWELKPAVMMGCGFGMSEPAVLSPAVENFLVRKSDAVSCSDFAWGGAPTPAIGIAFANRYSIYGAAWAIQLRGVSWQTLDSYLAFLFGFGMVCIYGLFRMATGRVLAVCGVAMFACSPILNEIVSLRDFVKFPCFTASWLALAWVIRRGLRKGATATIVPMAVGGALLGVGIGLRMDALILVPLFVAVAFVIVPGFGWRQLGIKTVAVAVFAVMFLAAGRPILRTLSTGSNAVHFGVLGLMAPFDPFLSVQPAPYDIGTQYADGYAYTVIVSHALLKQDEKLPILLGSADYDRVGGRLLGVLARQFPADILTRGLGATAQIFRMPFDWRVREIAEKMPTLQAAPTTKTIAAWRSWALGLVEGWALTATVLVLVLVSAFDRRLGAMAFLLTMYLCAYSMMQFSRRHTFHLDAFPILMAILLVQLPASLIWRIGARFRDSRDAGVAALRSYGREMLIGTGALAAVVVVFAGVVWGARAWQQQSVTALIDATLAAEWQPAPVTDEALTDTIFEGGRPVATWYESYIKNPDRWKTGTLLRVGGVVPLGTEAAAAPDLRQQYFKLTIDDRCNAGNVSVALVYSSAMKTFDSEFTRVFTVPTGKSGPSHLLVPAYYHLGSTWNRLDGFGVGAEQRSCITAIFRATNPANLPLPVLAVALGPDWRQQPLHQTLLAQPRVTSLGTSVDPRPTVASLRGSGWRRYNIWPLEHTAPPLDAWSPSENVAVTKRGNTFTVVGNSLPSGYQLMSPPLDVLPKHVVAVQIVGSVTRGEMCVGVLDGAQQRWLLAPVPPDAGLLADTQDNSQVRIVFSNCTQPPGEFTVRAISYQALSREP
jgi:hypothetical protein